MSSDDERFKVFDQNKAEEERVHQENMEFTARKHAQLCKLKKQGEALSAQPAKRKGRK